MDIRTLQVRLTALGYSLTPDGRYGPITRAAVLSALTDPPDRMLTADDIASLARRWGVDTALVLAVREVESTGDPFVDGRPTILFEPHRFSRATGRRFDASHPTVSYPGWGDRPYPRRQADRYAQLLDAVGLDVDAGFASASYGAFQVLGENFRICGDPDPLSFALAEARGEAEQLRHFAGFVEAKGLLPALRRRDWATFARVYNGTAYARNRYDVRLAAAYRAHAAQAA